MPPPLVNTASLKDYPDRALNVFSSDVLGRRSRRRDPALRENSDLHNGRYRHGKSHRNFLILIAHRKEGGSGIDEPPTTIRAFADVEDFVGMLNLLTLGVGPSIIPRPTKIGGH